MHLLVVLGFVVIIVFVSHSNNPSILRPPHWELHEKSLLVSKSHAQI